MKKSIKQAEKQARKYTEGISNMVESGNAARERVKRMRIPRAQEPTESERKRAHLLEIPGMRLI